MSEFTLPKQEWEALVTRKETLAAIAGEWKPSEVSEYEALRKIIREFKPLEDGIYKIPSDWGTRQYLVFVVGGRFSETRSLDSGELMSPADLPNDTTDWERVA